MPPAHRVVPLAALETDRGALVAGGALAAALAPPTRAWGVLADVPDMVAGLEAARGDAGPLVGDAAAAAGAGLMYVSVLAPWGASAGYEREQDEGQR